MDDLIPKKVLLDAEDIAKIFEYDKKTIYSKCSRKSKHPLPFKAVRVGRKLRFKRADVIKYIEGL